MSDDFDAIEKTFSEIKRLASAEPFEPFRLQVNGEVIPIDHPNSIGFHPEVPYLTVHTRDEIYKIAVENVTLIRESYTS